MGQDMVSTGQAAKLCAVTPDTILKWIKNNRLEAVRTAGGHYRIMKEKLKPYLAESQTTSTKELLQINYCWEYHAKDEHINESCRDCMIFKSKAEKCYLMAGLGKNAGHAQTFCKTSCYECEYFNFVNKVQINVLIISENREMRKTLEAGDNRNLTLKFSCCGYETSTIIQEYKPDYIIIDESMVNSNPDELCKHILEDPRAHGSQIVLAITEKSTRHQIPDGVCASIRIPFYALDVEECIQNLQKNFFGKQPVVNELAK
jgi:excisionase family DNA binding protein